MTRDRCHPCRGVRQSAAPQLEPGHRPPATPPPAPPRGQDRHQPQPPAVFRVTASRTQLRHPEAAAISDLHPDHAAPALTATVTVSPGSPTRYTAHYYRKARLPVGQPHPCTGAPGRAPRPRTPGRPAPAPPAPPASRSPEPPPRSSAHPPFPAAPARENHRRAGRTHGMHARLSGTRQAGTRRQRGPSVAVREKADGVPTVLRPGRRPLYVRGCRNTAPYSATR